MSAALARKRRAAGADTYSVNPGVQYNPNINAAPPAPKPTGLTLPQVIAVIDNRLIALESFVKEQKQSGSASASASSSEKSVTFALETENENEAGVPSDFIEEMQSRYEILAREIVDLKDIVLKLQSYTMDVNKTLLEERIHILSDLGDRTQAVETTMSSEEM
jgi:hypothetical protein